MYDKDEKRRIDKSKNKNYKKDVKGEYRKTKNTWKRRKINREKTKHTKS